MRRRIIITLLAALALVIAAIVLPVLFSKEPKYRGKTAEGWFRQYCRTAVFSRGLDGERNEEAVNCLKVLSTNSVPMLVAKFYSTNVNSWFETNLITVLDKLPSSWISGSITPASVIPDAAGEALRALRPPTELLVPLVTNRLRSPNENDRLRTLWLLSELNLDAWKVLPLLGDMLTSTNRQYRRMAMGCLSAYGQAAQPATPALARLLSSGETDTSLIEGACQLLVLFGNGGAAAIPALKARLASEPDLSSRFHYAKTIWQIDPGQMEALQIIIAVAAEETNDQRQLAIHTLGLCGTNGSMAAPVLAAAAKDEDISIWQPAAESLANIGQTKLMESAVIRKLDGTNLSHRLTAAVFLLRHNPTNSPATSLILDLLNKETTCSYVIARLDDFYPPPAPIYEALFNIITNRNHRFHQQAQESLAHAKGQAEAREEMRARTSLE